MWCDIDPYDWLNKLHGFYMAAVVGIVRQRDVSIHKRRGDYSPIRVTMLSWVIESEIAKPSN